MIDRRGQQIGNYRIIRPLGQGGFATVYLGEHIYLKTEAAIKLLAMRMPERDFQTFLKEAQTIARLKHPHIIRVLEFNIDNRNTQPFLVMEYAPRGSLSNLHPRRSMLSPDTIIPYVKQVADALQYAHDQRVVHRDVKPANMLVASSNHILLTDFGIAVAAHSSQSISTQNIVGTCLYMAPEQSMGDASPASDQYSLGCVVYEWLCGVCPFERDTPLAIIMAHLMEQPLSLSMRRPAISPLIEQVVHKALAKKPQQRFSSVSEFAQALEEAHQQSKQPLYRPAQFATLAFKHSSPQPAVSPYATRSEQPAPVAAPTMIPTILQPPPRMTPAEQPAVVTNIDRKPTFRLPPAQTPETRAAIAATAPIPQQIQARYKDLQKLLSSGTLSWQGAFRRAPLVWMCSLLLVLLLATSTAMWLSHIHTGGSTIHTTNAAPSDTGNATPQVSAKGMPATYGVKGALVLNDAAGTASPPGGWDSNMDPKKATGCRFEGNIYIVEQQHQNYCLAQDTNYSNFVYQIDMKIDWGNMAGILFRAQGNQQIYYDFQIGTDGTYVLYRSDSANGSDQPLKRGSSPALHQGYHQYNTLAVKAIGEDISLYANLTLVVTIHDPTPGHTQGSIGVGTYGDGDTEAAFRNAQVWQV
jgi:serine/threonine protein kinase